MMVFAFRWHSPIDRAEDQHFNILLLTWDQDFNVLVRG